MQLTIRGSQVLKHITTRGLGDLCRQHEQVVIATASRVGNENLIYRIFDGYEEKHTLDDRFSQIIADRAAYYGHLNLIIWLHERKLKKIPSSSFTAAASGGHNHIVKYLHANKIEFNIQDVLQAAAWRGNLVMLWWLFNDSKIDSRHWRQEDTEGKMMISAIQNTPNAQHHVMTVLKFLKENGCPFSNNGDEECKAAIKMEMLDVLKWLVENGCPWSPHHSHRKIAFETTNPEIIEWVAKKCFTTS